jgi:nitrate/TMAO reductase-like tetraheme cytochrome c subunit
MRTLSAVILVLMVYIITRDVQAGEIVQKGAQKCKACHFEIHAIWLKTKHATAFDMLEPKDRKNATCVGCHTTGSDPKFPGVQCEACHGAGGCLASPIFSNPKYKQMTLEQQRKMKIETGLITGEHNCRRCHNKTSPHYKEFDFKTRYNEIKHRTPIK